MDVNNLLFWVFKHFVFPPSGPHQEDELFQSGQSVHLGGHAGLRTQSAQRLCWHGGALSLHQEKVSAGLTCRSKYCVKQSWDLLFFAVIDILFNHSVFVVLSTRWCCSSLLFYVVRIYLDPERSDLKIHQWRAIFVFYFWWGVWLICWCLVSSSLVRTFLLVDGSVGLQTADQIALEMCEETKCPYVVKNLTFLSFGVKLNKYLTFSSNISQVKFICKPHFSINHNNILQEWIMKQAINILSNTIIKKI